MYQATSTPASSKDSTSNGTPRTATYTVAAPGGTWDAADNGSYTVALDANEVFDVAGNPVAANGSLAGFTVSIGSAPPPAPFRVQAESLSIVSGFNVATNPHASGGSFLVAGGSG